MATVAEKRQVRERRKDHRRRIAVEVALSLSDMNAGWGDYERALEHLAAADQLSGGVISPRTSGLRESLVQQAADGH
jgi:hypothetical protein